MDVPSPLPLSPLCHLCCAGDAMMNGHHPPPSQDDRWWTSDRRAAAQRRKDEAECRLALILAHWTPSQGDLDALRILARRMRQGLRTHRRDLASCPDTTALMCFWGLPGGAPPTPGLIWCRRGDDGKGYYALTVEGQMWAARYSPLQQLPLFE